MKVSEVSSQDGRMCAQLLNLLKAGKWELSGPDIAAHAATLQWVQRLAQDMGSQLNPPKATEGIKIKSSGPISGSTKKKK